MANVVLVGTLDTKGLEYAWIRQRLIDAGCTVTVVDVGVNEPTALDPDVDNHTVASRASVTLAELRSRADRGAAVSAMGEGAAHVLKDLHAAGQIDAILAVGGSGGSSIAADGMRALPLGVPKLLVSTMGSGDVSPYVGVSDIAVMYSVIDIAGLNRLSRAILGNAAAAAAGMAKGFEHGVSEEAEAGASRPLVAATMFGVTTPAVTAARARLEGLGYEVLVFHATGSGGRSMEALAEEGYLAGILDLTTTELADDLVGGVLSAGPARLEAAGRAGVPQVVSVGALDMVNFGPRGSVPEEFSDRNLYVHNATVTLMRTTGDEMAELGRRIATKLVQSKGPVALFLPQGGVSAIDIPGAPFHDPEADGRLFDELRRGIAGSAVELHEFDESINDSHFAVAAANRLHELISAHR